MSSDEHAKAWNSGFLAAAALAGVLEGAGGSAAAVLKNLPRLTAVDLLRMLAQNNVVLAYQQPAHGRKAAPPASANPPEDPFA